MKKTLLLLAAVATASGAFAEGYQVNNFSARQAGMANVGTAMKLGAESIYFNPAAKGYNLFNGGISLLMLGLGIIILGSAMIKWRELWVARQQPGYIAKLDAAAKLEAAKSRVGSVPLTAE